MTINCTLDDFRFPGLPTYPNQFGTKKVSGEGLSTAECCDDMAMPFNRQRPYIITETSDTTELHANSVFKITAADITLTIADAVYDGCTALIVNNSTGTVTVKRLDYLRRQCRKLFVVPSGRLVLVDTG